MAYEKSCPEVVSAFIGLQKGDYDIGAQENKDLVRQYGEALSRKPKPAAVVDLYVAEQSLKDHISGFEEACPNYQIDFEKLIAEDDLVSAIGTVRGTSTGPLMGMPATGKSFEIPIHITYRIADGKIVEHWMLVDNFAMMQQLGLIPSAAQYKSGQNNLRPLLFSALLTTPNSMLIINYQPIR